MEIKNAGIKDRKRLIEFFSHYKNKDLIKNRVDCYLKHNHTIIAEDNKKIIGLVQWYLKEDPNSGVAEFEEVFVSEDYRGQGIGSKLVGFAIQDVINFFNKNKIKLRKIFLFVNKDNLPARRLYEKFNFKFVAELNDLFSSKKELFYCLDL